MNIETIGATFAPVIHTAQLIERQRIAMALKDTPAKRIVGADGRDYISTDDAVRISLNEPAVSP